MKFANPAVSDQFGSNPELRHGTLLGSLLKDISLFLHNVCQHPAFGNGQCRRFLQINMFSCQSCFNGRLSMPMVRRRNHHGINILVKQHLTIIPIGFNAHSRRAATFLRIKILNKLFSLGEPVGIQVRYRNHPCHIKRQCFCKIVPFGNPAKADLGHIDLVAGCIGTENGRRNDGRGKNHPCYCS